MNGRAAVLAWAAVFGCFRDAASAIQAVGEMRQVNLSKLG